MIKVIEKSRAETARPVQRRRWLPIVVISLVAVVLRAYQLGTESVWIDEHFSIVDAQNLDLGTRPLYYLLLHGWMAFGESDAWLRSLSIPFSLGCVLLTYRLGCRLLSSAVGTVAAVMVAISPLFVGYGQQIRMYSLSTFLGLLGTLLLVKILQQPTGIRLGSVVSWLVVRLLAVMTTPLNVLLLLPDAILVLWRFRKDGRVVLAFVASVALACVVWFPFAQALVEALPRFMGGWVAYHPKPGLIRMVALLTGLTVFWPMSDLSSLASISLNVLSWGPEDVEFVFYMGFTATVTFLLGFGLFQVVRGGVFAKREMWWLAAWALLPTAVIASISWVSGSIWRERYLMFVAPYVLLLLAAGWSVVWQRYRRSAIAIAAVYGLAVSGGLGHYYTTLYHDNWHGIAELIEAQEQPGDVIGFYGWEWEDPQLTVPRYYKGEADFHVMQTEPIPSEAEATEAESFIQSMLKDLPPTESQYWLVYYEPASQSRKKLQISTEEQFDIQDHQIFPNSMNDALHVYQVQSLDKVASQSVPAAD